MPKISEQAIDYLEQFIPEMADAAVRSAYWQALAAGSSVVVSNNGEITEVFPDGTTQILKKNAPFVPLQKGQTIRLR